MKIGHAIGPCEIVSFSQEDNQYRIGLALNYNGGRKEISLLAEPGKGLESLSAKGDVLLSLPKNYEFNGDLELSDVLGVMHRQPGQIGFSVLYFSSRHGGAVLSENLTRFFVRCYNRVRRLFE